jgi:hypothetical protein
MNRRGADLNMKDLYGPGLSESLDAINRDNNMASVPTQDESEYPVITMKHRKRSAVLKQILKDGGFGDLAREVNIRGR